MFLVGNVDSSSENRQAKWDAKAMLDVRESPLSCVFGNPGNRLRAAAPEVSF